MSKKSLTFTAKVFQAGKAPKRIELLGDKQRPESAQHIIEFPGGAIELTRTTDGLYWAHIQVNRGDVIDDAEGRVSAVGRVVASRVDRGTGVIDDLPDFKNVSQIAVLIGREA